MIWHLRTVECGVPSENEKICVLKMPITKSKARHPELRTRAPDAQNAGTVTVGPETRGTPTPHRRAGGEGGLPSCARSEPSSEAIA